MAATANRKGSPRIAPDGYRWCAPEGGFGWVVSFGCLIITMIISTPIVAFGILLKDITQMMHTSIATASWTVSISLAVSQVVAPLATVSIHITSCRKTAMVGGILVFVGLLLSSFATTIEALYVTFGFITGVGIGLSRVPCLIIGSQYFPTRFGIVAGIIYSGFSVGRLVSPLVQLIKDEFGYQGTYIFMSAVCLNACVGASLFQPVARHLVLKPIAQAPIKVDTKVTDNNAVHQKSNSLEISKVNGMEGGMLGKDNGVDGVQDGSTPTSDDVWVEMKTYTKSRQEEEEKEKEIFLADRRADEDRKREKEVGSSSHHCGVSWLKKALLESLNFSMFKEPIFYVICASNILAYLTILYSNVFLVPLGVDKGLSPIDASLVLTAKSAAEIAGRLGFPWLQTLLGIDVVLFYIIICFVAALCLLAQALISNFAAFLAVAILTGVVTGGIVVQTASVTLFTVGVSRFPSTIGLCCFIQGFFALFAGPFIGLVRDITGSFTGSYLMIMGFQIISALLWTGRFACIKYASKHK